MVDNAYPDCWACKYFIHDNSRCINHDVRIPYPIDKNGQKRYMEPICSNYCPTSERAYTDELSRWLKISAPDPQHLYAFVKGFGCTKRCKISIEGLKLGDYKEEPA